ncbi:MAG: aspartate aminotransferase family protein, partial [Rhodobacteraceae bacterium]|nr:aspartate aminotransferase family protein [Paracoccaceae bacterium]
NDTLRANGVFKSPGKTYPSLILSEEDLAITQAAITKAAQAVADIKS